MANEEKIIAYKGFDKDLKCHGGFQYEIGKEYEMEGPIKACNRGFHACERPLDVFNHYPPSSRFCKVEQSGETSRDAADTKIASSKIKIGAEIGIPGLVKAQIEYVKAHTTNEHTDPKQATAGYRGAATAGNCGAATAGNCGAATAGNYGAATAGYRGAATAGNYGAATAGDSGAATAGDSGFALSGGSAACGANGVAVAKGEKPKAKGGEGAVLVLIVTDLYGKPVNTKTVTVGKTYKADTWYTVKDGRVRKVKE